MIPPMRAISLKIFSQSSRLRCTRVRRAGPVANPTGEDAGLDGRARGCGQDEKRQCGAESPGEGSHLGVLLRQRQRPVAVEGVEIEFHDNRLELVESNRTNSFTA